MQSRLFKFGVVLFAIFIIFSLIVGGDAVSGKIEDGRYYVSSHGKLKEVSRTVYLLSAFSVMVLCGMVTIFLSWVTKIIFKDLISITFKDIKEEGLLVFMIYLPPLIGLGFLWGTINAIKCILRAIGIIG